MLVEPNRPDVGYGKMGTLSVVAPVVGLAAAGVEIGSALPDSVSELLEAPARRRRLYAFRLCVESDDGEARLCSWSFPCDC